MKVIKKNQPYLLTITHTWQLLKKKSDKT